MLPAFKGGKHWLYLPIKSKNCRQSRADTRGGPHVSARLATLHADKTPQGTIVFYPHDVLLSPEDKKRYFTEKQRTPVDENREVKGTLITG
jgi:hypothetical protein